MPKIVAKFESKLESFEMIKLSQSWKIFIGDGEFSSQLERW